MHRLTVGRASDVAQPRTADDAARRLRGMIHRGQNAPQRIASIDGRIVEGFIAGILRRGLSKRRRFGKRSQCQRVDGVMRPQQADALTVHYA